jgi:hypothetical protein
MNFAYAIIIGFVAVSMITVVYRFEPNRVLARILIAVIYLTCALAILPSSADAADSNGLLPSQRSENESSAVPAWR